MGLENNTKINNPTKLRNIYKYKDSCYLMKKVVEMSLVDIAMTKIAVFLSTGFLLGLLMTYWPFQILLFLMRNKWYLLAGALLSAIIPVNKFCRQQKEKPKSKNKKKRAKK